jgi:adenylate kinase family enzyme
MIIGLIGAPRSGKDTVADFLAKTHDFKKIAFADQIKEEYFSKTDMTEGKYEELKKEGKCEQVREKLWNYSKGTKYKYGQNYFVNIVLDKINNDDNWVITDIRTKLELETALGVGVEIIFIKKNEIENNIEDSELSGGDIDGFDVIINDQTMEKLEENLQEFFGRKLMELEEPYKLD